MTKPLSMEKKQEIMNYLENHTWKETSKYFNISEMTINRIQTELPNNTLTSTNNIELLKGLYEIMTSKMNPKDTLNDNEMKLILTIEGVLNNE